jgi:hypothetical protein
MKMSEILSLARDQLDDNQAPFLWSDAELTAYLNKSLDELCEQAELIRDSSTPSICQIAISKDQAVYKLDDRVLDIKRARLVTYDVRITKRTTTFLDRYYQGWDSAMASPGTPQCFLMDQDSGKITLVPTPDADDNLKMTVVRLPLVPLSTSDRVAVPEIHRKYHFDLLTGVLWRAYSKQDSETYNPRKAEVNRVLWVARMNEIMLHVINMNDIDNQDDQVPDYLEDSN